MVAQDIKQRLLAKKIGLANRKTAGESIDFFGAEILCEQPVHVLVKANATALAGGSDQSFVEIVQALIGKMKTEMTGQVLLGGAQHACG